jgi:hypothetical protein
MIKYMLLVCLLCFTLSAQAQVDTNSYQTQRFKINELLKERSARFGQYDQSLNQRTGIFGFQTKKDIKNSNEILRQIVLNDNNIFKELKVLLEYKDLQVQQVQSTAKASNERISAYMAAIKKLQDQNEILRRQLSEQEKESGNASFYVILLMAALLVAAGYIIYTKVALIKKIRNA